MGPGARCFPVPHRWGGGGDRRPPGWRSRGSGRAEGWRPSPGPRRVGSVPRRRRGGGGVSWLRMVFVALVGIPVTFVLASWVLVAAFLRLPWAGRHCQPAGRAWARILLRAASVRVRFEGLEAVDWDQPHIVVANHQSWFDVFALAGHLPARYRFAAKEELGRIPIFGPAWKACGHISVARGNLSRAVDSLNQAGKRVRRDRLTVVMFPEGTRSSDGRLQAFRKGAFVLGIQTGVEIVPVGISGSRRIMPKGTFRIRPGEIVVRIGEPIPTAGREMKERNQLRDEARRRVLGLMDDPGALPGDVSIPGPHRGPDPTSDPGPEAGSGDPSEPPSGASDPPSSHEETRR
ncbi:MAG: 1-acyl-sn-glycerol-3-phosphate acyltransferase [Gemmatimonadales bacterium]|nr:MAG: 1-acyl-sn-glycerol-3-phosphate acyltransferase [Gemmatimonadales bacterium]